MNPLIQATQINTWFPRKEGVFRKSWIKAVHDVNLTIREGECLGLVGESGCGKSTLGRTLLRLAPLHSGKIHFRDQEISHLSPQSFKPFRPMMQMVFQDPKASLNPRMTVFQILKEALALDPDIFPAQRLEAAVRLMGLVDLRPEHIFRYPREFSGGQQQRISIARALATRPRFIVFDEATSALDVSVQAQIIGLMKDLQEKFNLTYLFISHDLSIMEHICHRVAVMYGGRIIEIQDARRLFTHPGHPYTRALKRAVPVADPGRRAPLGILEGEVPRLSHPPSGCYFHPRCPHAQPLCHTQYPPATSLGAQAWVHCHLPLTLEKESL
ncbi:MAG: ABC transporter ATP-binding protein [Desulfobacterales bacterium]|nr:ABC transporter ATP-binding protein [Desulfobacterales bacterium]